MISTQQICEAVQSLFSHTPPKKELKTEFIAACVQQYLQLNEPPEIADMVTALRQVEHCVPRPVLRQKGKTHPEIRWVFVSAPEVKPVRNRKPQKRNYTKTDIATSQRLKFG